MPWNGSGIYSRGYASWTNDANSGLPISATKFDTEDNDFAAGIQNCLTIDGQNKPNATLTWAQALNLTKASDATVFSVGRVSGTNNPTLTWSVADAAGVTQTLTFGAYALTMPSGHSGFNFTTSAYTFGNPTDNPSYVFAGSGSITAGGGTTNASDVLNIVVAGNCGLSVTNTTNTTNQKIWDVLADGSGELHFRLVNDAFNSANDWLNVTRTGFASAVVTFPNSLVEISDNAAAPSLWAAGYLDCPQNVQSGNYGLLLSDRGKSVYHGSASAHTYTIPANASIAFPPGTTIIVSNENGGGALTIAITTDTLIWAATGGTGSRTLAANGLCTLYKQTSTVWQISGTGLS
jgi:hypothetical protein